MVLCKFCSSVPLNLFSTDRDKQCTIYHQPSFQALQASGASGASGCEMCKLLLHAIQKQTEDGEYDRVWGPWAADGTLTLTSTKFDAQHVNVNHRQVGQLRGRVVPPEWIDPVPSHSDSASDKEIAVINYWLENCQNNHLNCAGGRPGFMPTRVIDVGVAEIQEPRLVLTDDLVFSDRSLNIQARRYLALSHCWGLTMPATATTTSITVSERLREIPMAGLSKTFADFIGIARRMRIQYVWIDSLCIMQDSQDDWEREAAQMASVYSNAYCTVAASASANGNGGCRVDLDSRPFGPVTVSFDEAVKDGNQVTQRVRIFSLFGKPIVNVLPSDPLTSRGWTLQERELSNRVLHYSHDTIRWECRSLKASLEFPWQDTATFNGALRIFDVGQIVPHEHASQAHGEEQKQRDQEAWFQAVGNYTSRALTRQTDKLSAFAGIARVIGAHTGNHYLAGLWERNLVHCLCWASAWSPSRGPTFDPGDPAPIHHARQSSYIAPSWSWACINGNVRYEWWIFHALDRQPNSNYIPKFLEAKVTPSGVDEYGAVSGGWLRLKGKVKAAFSRGEGFARQDREGIYETHDGEMREVGMIRFDIPSEAPVGKTRPLTCLCMLPRKERLGDSVGLALIPTKRDHEFQRVGLVFLMKLDWWAGCPEEEITIV